MLVKNVVFMCLNFSNTIFSDCNASKSIYVKLSVD